MRPSFAGRAIALLLALSPLVLSPLTALAAPPALQTPAPVIYLADNLDEKDNLGWCIDTLGRGFADRLQTHSCKPRGGDVQFFHDRETGIIGSVPFANKCATVEGATRAGAGLRLFDCVPGQSAQKFAYNGETGAFHPADDTSLCLAAGPASRTAGPFMSRTLLLAPCSTTDTTLRQWVINR